VRAETNGRLLTAAGDVERVRASFVRSPKKSTGTVAKELSMPKTTVWRVLRKHLVFNPLKPNDPYRGRTAPLTSKRSILYIYSTNIGTEYFKHGIYSPFFSPLQNAVCFVILKYLVPVLFTFYIFIQQI